MVLNQTHSCPLQKLYYQQLSGYKEVAFSLEIPARLIHPHDVYPTQHIA